MGLGNKMDVNEVEALEYLSSDPQTRIIGMYLEDVRDGRGFLEVARQAVKTKPLLLLKGARTQEGARASSSHTASLAVEDRVMDGALRQAGVIRVGSVEELVSSLRGFLTMPLPRGDGIALVTYSGAQAILSIDQAVQDGLRVARLKNSTLERLARVIATPSKAANPVDLFPDMMVHGFERTSTTILDALLGDEGVHAVIFISFAVEGLEPYEPLLELIQERKNKPVFFSLLGAKEHVEACRGFLESHGVPCFLYPETAVRVISHMWQYARRAEVA
jgi:acyl-CoA synthetase (NDP forming)